MRGEQFNPAYLAIKPKAVVPTLVHDGLVVPKSTIICEYVEEAFPERSVYPASSYLRARLRVWTKAVDEELHLACSALTYIVSHRHTILRSGAGNFEEFLEAGSSEGRAARTLKWQWVQHGLAAPGAADKIALYDGYLAKMEQALGQGTWLVGDRFSMADIAMVPYVNRLDTLAMSGMWAHGRFPLVERWLERVRQRPSFKLALLDRMPPALSAEMFENGERSRPDIKNL